MIKLGVHRLEDFTPNGHPGLTGRVRRFFGANRISYRLLRTSMPPTEREVTVFEQITRDMQLSSGVYRLTFRRRFEQVDPIVNGVLAERAAGRDVYEVEDWAASNCLTSMEWAQTLFPAIPQSRLTTTDLTLHLIEVELPNGDCFIGETNGALLQYLQGPLTVRLVPDESALAPVNWWIGKQARARWAEIWNSLTFDANWLDGSVAPGSELKVQSMRVRSLPMVHPEVLDLSRREPRFTVAHHSIFNTRPRPADAIRSMNIFNWSYFDSARMAEGARAVWNSLHPGGLWIVGRTITEHPLEHHFSIFEKGERGFRQLPLPGPESEIAELVRGLDFEPVRTR